MDLNLPERFTHLKEEQQTGALVALRQVDEALRQAVLDEWDVRCADSTIRKPAGYLFGIIQKALKGEFNPMVGANRTERQPVQAPPSDTQPASPPVFESRQVSSEVARQHLARLRKLISGGGQS